MAYLRVSTDSQADSGAGLAAQERACRTRAAKEGLAIAAVHSDAGLSSITGLDARPGLLAAVSMLEQGDVLLVAKRDRLGRDPIVVAMIEAAVKRRGARVVSAAGEGTDDDGPTAVLMRRIVDAFGEYERLLIKARTSAALQAKRSKQERVGHIPFGWHLAPDGVHLELDQAEQVVLAKMTKLRAKGLSYRALAAELNKRGARNRHARPWNHVTVQGMLKRTEQ